eukprot:m.410954 g.410954  ORF g.410954 m.410954 type:complete len:195 (-) comp28532_c0_seq1:89-673(-)
MAAASSGGMPWANAELNGLVFGDSPVADQDVIDSYNANLSGRIAVNASGGTADHQLVVVSFVDHDFTVKFELWTRFQEEPKLIYRIKRCGWEPRSDQEVQHFDKSISLRKIVDHGSKVSEDFGSYVAGTNDCQTWANTFLEPFGLRKETFWEGIKRATLPGLIVTGVGLSAALIGGVLAAALGISAPLLRLTLR